jgi:hypothetical protein
MAEAAPAADFKRTNNMIVAAPHNFCKGASFKLRLGYFLPCARPEIIDNRRRGSIESQGAATKRDSRKPDASRVACFFTLSTRIFQEYCNFRISELVVTATSPQPPFQHSRRGL